jgi:hypothetical protein
MSKTKAINAKAVSDMMKFTEKAKGKVQMLTKEVLLEIGRRLVDRSPIGFPPSWKESYWPKNYHPGHFIHNWQVGVDKKPVGIIQGFDPSGRSSLERLSHLGRWQVGHTYFFTNNVPYAYQLETGWSPQCPPGGMIGLIKREFPQIVREVEARVRDKNVNS